MWLGSLEVFITRSGPTSHFDRTNKTFEEPGANIVASLYERTASPRAVSLECNRKHLVLKYRVNLRKHFLDVLFRIGGEMAMPASKAPSELFILGRDVEWILDLRIWRGELNPNYGMPAVSIRLNFYVRDELGPFLPDKYKHRLAYSV